MAFKVQDPLGSVPPPDPLNVPAAGTKVSDLSSKWTKRGANIEIRRDIDGSYANATRYGGGIGSATWVGDSFHADQYAEMAHGPLAWHDTTGGPLVPVGGFPMGVCVRQDASTDTCYVLHTLYESFEGGGANLHLFVYRVVAGTKTLVAHVAPPDVPSWAHRDDWWFVQIQAWGADPVNLRVITKAPIQYVVTDDDPLYLPDFETAAYVVDGVTATHDGYLYVPDSRRFAASYFSASPNEDGSVAVLGTGARADPRQSWVIWEGQDSSASRILSGRPGIRWDGMTISNGGWGAAHFTAGELDDRLHATAGNESGGAVILSGTRVPGSTITVT